MKKETIRDKIEEAYAKNCKIIKHGANKSNVEAVKLRLQEIVKRLNGQLVREIWMYNFQLAVIYSINPIFFISEKFELETKSYVNTINEFLMEAKKDRSSVKKLDIMKLFDENGHVFDGLEFIDTTYDVLNSSDGRKDKFYEETNIYYERQNRSRLLRRKSTN